MFIRGKLSLGNTCNNDCIFCCHHQNDLIQYQDISNNINLIKNSVDQLIFSCPEATIHPNFFKILKLLKENNVSFGIITNGRIFSDMKIARKILDFGCKYIEVSLHSDKEKIHDYIVRSKGAWKQTIKGIRNIKFLLDSEFSNNPSNKNIEFIVKAFVSKYLLSSKADFYKFIKNELKMSKIHLKIMFLDNIMDNKNSEISKIIPSIIDLKKYLKKSSLLCTKNNINLTIEGVPYCFIDSKEHVQDNEDKNIFYTFIFNKSKGIFELVRNYNIGDNFVESDINNECLFCSYVDVCNYSNKKNDEITKYYEALIKDVPPAFTYRKTREFEYQDKCPFEYIDIKPHAYISDKCLFFHDINDKDKLSLFCAESNYFKIKNIKQSKEKGLIFINNTKVKQSVDFDQYSSLSLKDFCKTCEKTCCGVFVKGSDFSFIDYDFQDMVDSFKGNILEVGCGKLLLTKKLAYSKGVNYYGLEPDKEMYDEVREKFRELKFVNKTAENLSFLDVQFDYILFLGTYNHIPNLRDALLNMKKFLKPTGKIIVADNLAHANIETKTATKYGPEDKNHHYRNHSAHIARNVLENLDYKIEKYRDSNDYIWFLSASNKQSDITKYVGKEDENE